MCGFPECSFGSYRRDYVISHMVKSHGDGKGYEVVDKFDDNLRKRFNVRILDVIFCMNSIDLA